MAPDAAACMPMPYLLVTWPGGVYCLAASCADLPAAAHSPGVCHRGASSGHGVRLLLLRAPGAAQAPAMKTSVEFSVMEALVLCRSGGSPRPAGSGRASKPVSVAGQALVGPAVE